MNAPAEDLINSPRTWQEDFSFENGNYINSCCSCRLQFAGHKRRLICKLCADKPMTVEDLIGFISLRLANQTFSELSLRDVLYHAERFKETISELTTTNYFSIIHGSEGIPWALPELTGWSIAAMNHYYLEQDGKVRRIYVAMNKGDKMIKVEGPDTPSIWLQLAAKAKEIDGRNE